MIAGSLLGILYLISALVALVLHIMLLVKLFKHAGVGLGILGIFCGLFAFIWGWMKCGEYGFKKLMVWLTVAIVISAVLGGASGAAFGPSIQQQNLPERSY